MAQNVIRSLKAVGSKYPVFFRESYDGWFDKPSVIAQALTNSDKVCCLDNDLEILKNFDDIFDISQAMISGVKDYLYPDVFNAGVLVFHREALDAVLYWENLTQTKLFRSDQEALQVVRQSNPELFKALPMTYNHQRWAIKNNIMPHENTKLIHWTGDDGKKILRDKFSTCQAVT